MKLIKQIILLPLGVNGLPLHQNAVIEECMKSYNKDYGYFFTPEQLNEYTQSVIKEALKTAAKKAKMNLLIDEENDIVEEASIDKQSITNTFEKTFKKFEV